MNGLECHQEEFVLNAEVNGKPMEMLKDRGDMVVGGGACYDAGS